MYGHNQLTQNPDLMSKNEISNLKLDPVEGISFEIDNNLAPFTEQSFGLTLPLLPMNSNLIILIKAKALVNTIKNTNISNISPNQDNYPL